MGPYTCLLSVFPSGSHYSDRPTASSNHFFLILWPHLTQPQKNKKVRTWRRRDCPRDRPIPFEQYYPASRPPFLIRQFPTRLTRSVNLSKSVVRKTHACSDQPTAQGPNGETRPTVECCTAMFFPNSKQRCGSFVFGNGNGVFATRCLDYCTRGPGKNAQRRPR